MKPLGRLPVLFSRRHHLNILTSGLKRPFEQRVLLAAPVDVARRVRRSNVRVGRLFGNEAAPAEGLSILNPVRLDVVGHLRRRQQA